MARDGEGSPEPGGRQPYATRDETFAAFERHVSASKVALYRGLGLDVVMGAREGAQFRDAWSGAAWFNCHCNGGLFNLGHRHPRVAGAVRDALETLDAGNHHLVSGWRAALAARLAATTDQRLERVAFGVSGGEAIDLAIKVARAATGRRTIVSALGGFHGHTGLALAAGDAAYREPFGPNLPGFVQVPFDDLEAMERAIGDDTAAVLLEPVPATLGVPIPGAGYLPGVQALCRERGAKLILDEVQTGLGRTGRLWCCEHDGLAPDLLVTGKGLGGGVYPISATLMTPAVHAALDAWPFAHVSTWGGAEPGCVAALAVLDVVQAPGFLERVAALSDRFARAFEGLPFALRRRGLMMGLKLPRAGDGVTAARRLYAAGLFCAWANNDTSAVQFLPPLVLSDAEADEIAARVRRAFS